MFPDPYFAAYKTIHYYLAQLLCQGLIFLGVFGGRITIPGVAAVVHDKEVVAHNRAMKLPLAYKRL